MVDSNSLNFTKSVPNNSTNSIRRGEQTASQLEANLSSLEAKLDAMLAGLEQQEKEKHNPETKVGQKEISDEERELKMDLEEADELKHIKEDQGKGNFEGK